MLATASQSRWEIRIWDVAARKTIRRMDHNLVAAPRASVAFFKQHLHPEARELCSALADGVADAPLTREARATLRRMTRWTAAASRLYIHLGVLSEQMGVTSADWFDFLGEEFIHLLWRTADESTALEDRVKIYSFQQRVCF